MQADVQKGLDKLDMKRVNTRIMEDYSASANMNKNYKYTVTEERVEVVPILRGKHTVVCLPCRQTCVEEEDCSMAVINSSAMDHNGNCKVCTGRCRWDVHKSLPHKYEIKPETVEKKADDLQSRYYESLEKQVEAEKSIDDLDEEFAEIQSRVMRKINKICRLSSRIKNIALESNPLFELEYIDRLIYDEGTTKHPGWEERRVQLIQLQKQVAKLETYKERGFDPFAFYNDK